VGCAGAALIATPEQLVSAKAELLSLILAARKPMLDADLARAAEQYLADQAGTPTHDGICSERPCRAGRGIVALTADGQILPCGRALQLRKQFNLPIIDGTPAVMVWHDRLRCFHQVQQMGAECVDCSAREICTGGCPSFLWQAPEMRVQLCLYWKGIATLLQRNLPALRTLFRERDRCGTEPLGVTRRRLTRPDTGLSPDASCSRRLTLSSMESGRTASRAFEPTHSEPRLRPDRLP
jgi:radical SAM protein with 4Fe4S-binding SPASM domain